MQTDAMEAAPPEATPTDKTLHNEPAGGAAAGGAEGGGEGAGKPAGEGGSPAKGASRTEERLRHVARTELRRALKAAVAAGPAGGDGGDIVGFLGAFTRKYFEAHLYSTVRDLLEPHVRLVAMDAAAAVAPKAVAAPAPAPPMPAFADEDLRGAVRAALEHDLAKLLMEVRGELHAEARAAATAQMRAELKAELRAELKAELAAELASQLKAEIRAELAGEIGREVKRAVRSLPAPAPPAVSEVKAESADAADSPDSISLDPASAPRSRPAAQTIDLSMLDDDPPSPFSDAPGDDLPGQLPRPKGPSKKKRDPNSPFERLNANFREHFKDDPATLSRVLSRTKWGTELHGRIVSIAQEFNRRCVPSARFTDVRPADDPAPRCRRNNPDRSGSYLILAPDVEPFVAEVRRLLPGLWRSAETSSEDREPRRAKRAPSEAGTPGEQKGSKKPKTMTAEEFLDTKPKCDCGLLVYVGMSKEEGPNKGKYYARCGRIVPKCMYKQWL
ncbi:hypothetical protein DFJ74DRAFT_695719 [Hyaloraphidium curvatum]|nr:hypothetical protein DFJ74DRAFT_695719 [Hyaloraphidium curvatum]